MGLLFERNAIFWEAIKKIPYLVISRNNGRGESYAVKRDSRRGGRSQRASAFHQEPQTMAAPQSRSATSLDRSRSCFGIGTGIGFEKS
jgi:hypothetical protein